MNLKDFTSCIETRSSSLLVLIMRLDEEDLHQQIKSQDSSAPALLNDSGEKNG